VTLSKLAQLANVSVSVVSKAFSGREDVSDAMREHVFAVAREHGCFQQFYHAPYDKPVVAVIIPEAISGFYIRYVEVLKQAFEERGYTLLLSISNFDPQMVEELVRYYTAHGKVDALVSVGNIQRIPEKTDTAVICIDGAQKEPIATNCYRIKHILATGLEDALLHLKNAGRKRIAYVGEPLTMRKEPLVRNIMEQTGLPVYDEYFICSRMRFLDAGRDGIEKLWQLSEKPDAIFGSYREITTGMLYALEERGVSVPRDVAVIAMNNDPAPIHPTLDVSCIDSGIVPICAEVMRLLDETVRVSPPPKPRIVSVPSVFHIGKTT